MARSASLQMMSISAPYLNERSATLTGNLESVALLGESASRRGRWQLQLGLTEALRELWDLPQVGDIRQVGLVIGVELVRNSRTREPFDLRQQIGIRVCDAMASRGVLTRPIGNVIVLLPPFCMTPAQVRRMVGALAEAIREVASNA